MMSKSKKQLEIQRNIDLFLDHAMHNEESAHFMHEVENNPEYPKLIDQEMNFRNFIKNNVKRPGVSTDLIQSIINRIKID
ncbi:MAG TPA: hypothetical protein DCQ58_02655 [Saprospirales bacterium]|nr:hypothetical protein [Saprospirales bacterium]